MLNRLLLCAAIASLGAQPLCSQGHVYLVLGSDTAIWDGMDVARYQCTYALSLFTDPLQNAARVMDPAFRATLTDSYGSPVKLTWWMMAGNIFRHATNTDIPDPNTMTMYLMKKYQGTSIAAYGDELSLHYHTFVWTDYDGDGTWYWNQAHEFSESADDFDVTLATLLLEEGIFPVSFRSGWHAMDNGWQRRLDSLFLFSMHNDWPARHADPVEPIDNVYDWSRAPGSFVPFHPSPDDYQVPGNGRGWNVRSSYMSAADSTFMERIFAAAAAGTDQVVCLWAHLPEADFLDNVRKVNSSSHKAATRHPGVTFRYCTAVEAMQRWLRTADTTRPALSIQEIPGSSPLRWRIETNEPAFQPAPFVGVKTRYEEFAALPVRTVAANVWETAEGVSLADVAKVGAAITDTAGNVATAYLRYLPDDVFVDDADPGFSEVSGSWVSSATAAWGRTSRVTAPGSTLPAEVQWTPLIPNDGLYNISVRVPRVPAPAQKTLFRMLEHGIPQDTVAFLNPLVPDSWIHLTTRQLRAGSSFSLTLSSAGQLPAGTQIGADVAKFSALVKDRWIVAPQQIDGGELVEGEPAGLTFEVRNEGIQPTALLGLLGVRGFAAARDSFPIEVPPMGSATMHLQISTASPGSIIDTLLMGTDDPRHGLIRIPVRASVVPFFRIIDDLDSAGYTETGGWATSVAQAWGVRSRYAFPAAGVSATFSTRLMRDGTYAIQEIVPRTVNATTRARYVLRSNGVPVDTAFADQNTGSGAWKTLMTFSCPAGVDVDVTITDAMSPPAGDRVLRADAFRFQWTNDGTTSAGGAGEGMPLQYSLEQNYPNPFNPTTNIQLTIVNRQWTIVKVFDLLGREVATLMNEVKDPGTYTLQFDARLTGGQASHLASGVYMYRLTAGEFVVSRKMLLVR